MILLLRRILSIALLVVFFFSTTPRQFLHHLFANHHDTIDQPIGPVDQVSTIHIHCAFLHINIAPYISPDRIIHPEFVRTFPEQKEYLISPVPLALNLHYSLRAPPEV